MSILTAKEFAEKHAGEEVTVICPGNWPLIGKVVGWVPDVQESVLGLKTDRVLVEVQLKHGGKWPNNFIVTVPCPYSYAGKGCIIPEVKMVQLAKGGLPKGTSVAALPADHPDRIALDALYKSIQDARIDTKAGFESLEINYESNEPVDLKITDVGRKLLSIGPKEPCPRHYTGDQELSCTCVKRPKSPYDVIIDNLK